MKRRRIILEDDIELYQIDLFNKQSDRTKNDENNKIRENILENILTLERRYFTNKQYGEQWKHLKNEFMSVLNIKEDDKTQIIRKAGRKNNYDYYIHYKNGDREKLEFKSGSKSMFNLPQILQLTDDKLMDYTYSDFFYEKYLDDLCEVCNTKKIDKDDYIKNIKKTSSDIDMFKSIKEFENKTKKDKIVNNSIKEYLESYYKRLNLKELYSYLRKSLDKTYLMWDYKNKKFTKEKLDDDFNKLIIKQIKNNNTIIVQSKYEYRLLLRWKNGKGVLTPAWQIGIRKIIS
jgi:hypothetical protein